MKIVVKISLPLEQEDQLRRIVAHVKRRAQIDFNGRKLLARNLGDRIEVGEIGHCQKSKPIIVKIEDAPKIWGPGKWDEIHSAGLLLTSPGARKDFISKLQIPCGKCKKHWKEFLVKNPPTYDSDYSFFAWTVFAHNHVNQIADDPKPQMLLSDALTLWHRKLGLNYAPTKLLPA